MKANGVYLLRSLDNEMNASITRVKENAREGLLMMLEDFAPGDEIEMVAERLSYCLRFISNPGQYSFSIEMQNLLMPVGIQVANELALQLKKAVKQQL